MALSKLDKAIEALYYTNPKNAREDAYNKGVTDTEKLAKQVENLLKICWTNIDQDLRNYTEEEIALLSEYFKAG